MESINRFVVVPWIQILFRMSFLPSGGSGSLIYSWYQSVVGPPFNTTNWSLIVGADEAEYDPGVITTTTWFVRLVRREDCPDDLSSNMVVVQLFSSPSISSLVKEVDCHGALTGGIDITVTGGLPAYSYLWSNGETTEDLINIGAGTYSVTVTDQNGCTADESIDLADPEALQITGAVSSPTCNGYSDGSIDLEVSGGSPAYHYSWVTGDTSQDIEDISAGIYSVTVHDQAGCSATAEFEVTEPQLIQSTLIATDVSCAGQGDGGINLTVTGGTEPYTYLWSSGDMTQHLTNLSGDIYQVTITDANGCSHMSIAEVLEPAPLALTISGTPPVCEGGSDGHAEVSVTGGTLPYSYLWDDPSGGSTPVINNLPAGTYSVTVTDDNGCSQNAQITLEEGTEDCEIVIGDYVWLDSDRDGIQDNNEYGENGILVKLVQTGPDGVYGTADDTVIDSTYTSGFGFNTGYYLFTDVQPGTYSICFSIDTSFQFTMQNVGSDDAIDSDPDPATGCLEPFTILPNDMDDLTFDAGIHARCANVTDGGLIGYDEVLCKTGGDPDEIVNIVFPTGGLGVLEYLWLQSDTDENYFPGNPNWTPITNSNSPNYDPGPIQATTYYIRCSRREGCLDYPGETNIVTKEIIEPVAEITGPTGTICVDKDYFFMATSNGPNATYHWEFGADANPSSADGLVVNNVSWSTSGLKTVTLTVTVSGCVATESVQIELEECGGKPIFESFAAFVNDDLDVVLEWHAHSFDEDHVFLVERSLDGVQFDYLLTVPGLINTKHVYRITDDSPEWGESFYRVRMASAKGSSATSEVVRVVVKERDMFNVSIYPNPVSSELNIRVLVPSANEATVIFYDLLGRIIHQEVLAPGERSVLVNCQKWQDGPVAALIVQEGKRPFTIMLQKAK